jgi:hypothetical protein
MLRKNKINVIPECFSFCHPRIFFFLSFPHDFSGNPLLLLWMPYPHSKMADKLNYSGMTTLLILALLSKNAVLRNIS